MTALNLGSLSKGIGEGFPYLERFEGICKEYAAAQVAEKDAEIARLKAETNEISQCLLDCENAKQRLESVIDRKNEQGLSERSIIQGLKAENERLMEVVQRARQYCESGNGRGGATKLPSGEWFDEGDGTLYHAILSAISPAPEKPEEKPATDSPQLADKYAILHRALGKIRRMRKTERYWDGETMTKIAIEALEKVK
jgi:hypothetical protein